MKFIELISSLDLGSNICFGLCTFLDIYIWTIFIFAWVHSIIMLVEYEFMTRGARNFIEENETRIEYQTNQKFCLNKRNNLVNIF